MLSVALQLQLDLLAIEVSACLRRAGVPHALLKGITTAAWLYDPPRHYRDVDILVPSSRLDDAVGALLDDGVAQPEHGALGEEGSHSLVLLSSWGAEIDLHVSLPSLPTPAVSDDRIWCALEPHLAPFSLDSFAVPALDVPGRCLVLALHVIASGQLSAQVREDFRRARSVVSRDEWGATLDLAASLDVRPYVDAAEAVVDGRPLPPVPADVRLQVEGASGSAIQLNRLMDLPIAQRLPALLREVFPSQMFLERMYPDAAQGRISPAAARLRRLRGLVRALPNAWRELRSARTRRRTVP